MADAEVPVAELTGDPVTELEALQPRRNPAIPLPRDIFPGRANSAGVDLADPLMRGPLVARLEALTSKMWTAESTVSGGASTGSARAGLGSGLSIIPAQAELVEAPSARPITSPHDQTRLIGHCTNATADDVDLVAHRAAAAQPGWDALGGETRARLLDKAADAFEAHTDEILSLCLREAGKTLPDAVLELREAVDFLRFYAGEARRLFTHPTELPGPTGESNACGLPTSTPNISARCSTSRGSPATRWAR